MGDIVDAYRRSRRGSAIIVAMFLVASEASSAGTARNPTINPQRASASQAPNQNSKGQSPAVEGLPGRSPLGSATEADPPSGIEYSILAAKNRALPGFDIDSIRHSQVFLKFRRASLPYRCQIESPGGLPNSAWRNIDAGRLELSKLLKIVRCHRREAKRVSESPLNDKPIFFYPEMTRHNRLKAAFRQNVVSALKLCVIE
jgi:hypothetical protein